MHQRCAVMLGAAALAGDAVLLTAAMMLFPGIITIELIRYRIGPSLEELAIMLGSAFYLLGVFVLPGEAGHGLRIAAAGLVAAIVVVGVLLDAVSWLRRRMA
jgi:hypothetical protein